MQLQTCSQLEYFEERKRLLRELLDSQYAAEAALLHSSFCELGRVNSEQLRICERLSGLALPRTEKGGTPSHGSAVSTEAQGVRGRDLKTEIMRLENEVRYRNRVFSAVLARVRRTMNIFARALASLGPTYLAKDIARV
jgi:hypothetical protein